MRICLLAVLIVTAYAISAQAHKVNLLVYVQEETCFVEGFYSPTQKATGARVEVFNPEGRKLLQGETDSRGNFAFKIPEEKDLKIVLTTQLGHKAVQVINVDEMGTFTMHRHEDQAHPPADETERLNQGFHNTDPQETVHIDRKELEEMIHYSLDKKLTPLYALIARTQEKQGLHLDKVVSGLGYILGILGIALFFSSRKQKK